jgi:sulfur relay protein TusB/DsrH
MKRKLFIINRQDDKALEIALSSKGGNIFLFQDAVYYLKSNSKTVNKLEEKAEMEQKIFALESEVIKRGIREKLIAGVELITYDRLVDLLFEGYTVINL